MPLWLYGPLIYQNYWVMILANINVLLPNYFNDIYNILIHHYPEYR